MKIGVLALQGDFREHIFVLRKLGVEAAEVRLSKDLSDVHGLIIPGGESTAIGLLMKKTRLDKKIKDRHKEGMPIYGSCAGAILLAKNIIGSRQSKLGLVDVSIKRNDYGRQLASFEADLEIKDMENFRGVFIRAPTIKKWNGCEVLSKYGQYPVLLRDDNILVSTFHPELTNDSRIHQYFLGMVKEFEGIKNMQKDLDKIPTE